MGDRELTELEKRAQFVVMNPATCNRVQNVSNEDLIAAAKALAEVGELRALLDGERKAKGRLARKVENQRRLICQHNDRLRELNAAWLTDAAGRIAECDALRVTLVILGRAAAAAILWCPEDTMSEVTALRDALDAMPDDVKLIVGDCSRENPHDD